MRIFQSSISILLLGFALGSSPIEADIGSEHVDSRTEVTVIATATPTPEESPNSAIRKVDFQNFTFPWTKEQGAPGHFTLKNGEKAKVGDQESGAVLGPIEFGDVTNDGQEEALIHIFPVTGGNCSCDMVYVYTVNKGVPKLLWNFDTWDRAQGGFKRAYAENGDLIIELFGDDKYENGKWHFDLAVGKSSGLCCPTTFTRSRFHWNGRKFVLVGKPELFDYDSRKDQGGKN